MANRKNRIQVLSTAQLEVLESINWYKKINPALSIRLKNEVKEGYKSIANNPGSFQIRYDSIRLYHLRIFPYSIHYEWNEQENLIQIFAFLHQHQNLELP